MFAYYLRKPIRHGVSIVRLERDQRRGADGEVVEIDLGDILRKPGCRIGDNAEATGTSHKTERGKRRFAARGVIQVSSRTEKSGSCFVHGRRSKSFGIAYDKFLGTGWRRCGEAWDGCAGQRAQDRRIVEVIVERPITSLLIGEVDALADLVVSHSILLTVVRVRTRGAIGRRNVRKNTARRRRPCRRGNHAAGKNAGSRLSIGQCIAASDPVWLTICYGVA